MERVLKTCVLALSLAVLSAGSAAADVKTRDKSQVKFEGFLGRMMGMFGGKAASEGLIRTNAVQGSRKVELNDTTGRIVDLEEEKIYELDMKKRTYQVTTFDELRRRMREAQEKAERESAKADRDAQQEQQEQLAREVDVDFDIKETGQKKALVGYDAREVIMAVTVRPKGRTLEEGGGVVMTSNAWMGPAIPAMKELADFEVRYWKAIAPEATGMSAEQMAAVTAMYPMLKSAMERLQSESSKLEGTPLATTTVFETVKSKEEMGKQSQSRSSGGIGGMIANRMMKRDNQPRSTVLTITHETLEVTPEVAAADMEIPAGFKERK